MKLGLKSSLMAVFVTSTLLVGGVGLATPANAATPPASGPVVPAGGSLSPTDLAAGQAAGTKLKTELVALPAGGNLTWTTPGGQKITLTKSAAGISVSGIPKPTAAQAAKTSGPSAYSIQGYCQLDYTIAIGIFVLGGAALVALAIASAPFGGAEIAGTFLATSDIWAASAIAGSLAAIEAWIEPIVC